MTSADTAPVDPALNITLTDLPYNDGGTALTGVLCRNESFPGTRPGILLVHGGAGLDNHARAQARRYAALGYVVLACDMFGEGIAGDRDRVLGCITALRDDPPAMVRRAQAGLAALSRCRGTLASPGTASPGTASPGMGAQIAVIGFCFGGMVALALARSGENLSGVVSIHGSLATTQRAAPGATRARILVCHGARDPHVPPRDVAAFAEEMNAAGADWELIMYGGALHGFTHADTHAAHTHAHADTHAAHTDTHTTHTQQGAIPGVAYDPVADSRSFAAVSGFLADVLGWHRT
ncbi:MAG TPA: dienelactone hydrolase family protein [Streptosporangiaceae bacterium]|nr:dienelactone hydrolase family protein [Streptosporangiaceae bacterium]